MFSIQFHRETPPNLQHDRAIEISIKYKNNQYINGKGITNKLKFIKSWTITVKYL